MVNKRSVYGILTITFILLTIVELFEYFLCDSSLFGLVYLILNFIIIFFLGMVTINFNKASKFYRISKIFIVIFLGIFSSFFLRSIIYMILDYKVYSSTLESLIFLTKNLLKPIIYFLLLLLNLIEWDKELKLKNKRGIFSVKFVKKLLHNLKINHNN